MQGGAIHFNFLQKGFSLKNRTQLKKTLLDILSKEGRTTEMIEIIFCSDAYLLTLNKRHLQHNYFTDIVTFDYPPRPMPVQADIFISIDRVRENAAIFKVPFYKELTRVMIHGMLHLCGYQDKTKKQIEHMRLLEDRYLKKCFT